MQKLLVICLAVKAFYNLDTKLSNLFRNLGEWSFFSGYKGTPYHHYSGLYSHNTIIIITSFSIPILVLASYLFITIRKKVFAKWKYRQLALFYIVPIILFPLIGGTNLTWSTHSIAQWVFAHVPFAETFRNTYKFMSLVTLCYAVVLTVFLDQLSYYFKRSNQRIRSLLVFSIFLGLVLVNTLPLWTGGLYEKDSQTANLPHYWSQAAAYVNRNMNPSFDRILLLPDQYFPVFQWPTGRKKFPTDFTSITFNTPVVYDLCKGCGQYYTSLVQKYIYTHLGKHNLEKYLGLINISTILQRNDYDYKYYDVQSPDKIKELLAEHPSVTKTQTFGQLDFYKLANPDVYPRVYSPDRVIFTDTLDEGLASFDDFVQPGHKTSLILSSQFDPRDTHTIPDANSYFKLFDSGKAKIDGDKISQTIEVKQPSSFQITHQQAPTTDLVNLLDSHNIKVNTTSKGFSLQPGQYHVDTALVKIPKELMHNGSFEEGSWQPIAMDCQLQNDNAPVGMHLVDDATQGKKSLELSAKLDIGCEYSSPIQGFDKAKDYVLSFDYKLVHGKFASYCVWDGSACINSADLFSQDSNWHHAEVPIKPNEGSKQLVVFLYASAADGTPATVRYDNVSVQALQKNVLETYTILPVQDKLIKPINIMGVSMINSTKYELSVLVTRTGLINFQESFHPGWRAFIQPLSKKRLSWWEMLLLRNPGYSIAEENHVIVNGFANGWWVDPSRIPAKYLSPTGQYRVTLEFWPQRWFYLGSIISGTTLVGCIGYLVYDRRRRKRRGKTLV